MLAGLRWGERGNPSMTPTACAEERTPGTPHAGPRGPITEEAEMSRKTELKAMAPKGHPTGPIGRPGSYQRRQLGAIVKGGRVLAYHATKGWRNRRA